MRIRHGNLTVYAALLAALLGCAGQALGWSWPPAEGYAPPTSLFTSRGTATIAFGSQYAAPGAPAALAPLYGVIQYRDSLEAYRNYDLFFSPALAVWKFWRYEPGGATHAQYVGGFHYDNCQDGNVTATDRVFMPAMGATNATECGSPVTSVRTNYGCRNSHFSNPFPLDNYQGAGSGNGDQPDIVVPPSWSQNTQTLSSVTISKPWIYYPGILDPNSPRFQQDFIYCPNKAFIQQQAAAALNNVRLENQIRVYPDGTVMLTHIWSDLKGRPWVSAATDGYWIAPDSAPNGRVFYYDVNQNNYVEPFANGQNPNGLYLTTGNGWVGYFIDTLRPSIGMGFYYYIPGGIGIFAANNWPNSPAVVHTDYFTSIPNRGRAFRQMFLLLGTKEEMQSKAGAINNYVKVLTAPPTSSETFCSDGIDDDGDGRIDCLDSDCAPDPACSIEVCIRPTGPQDGEVAVASGVVDTTSQLGRWGQAGGAAYTQLGLHTLPHISAAQLVLATLKLPRTDNPWTADTSALNLDMRLRHIAAADPAQITLPDGTSAALAELGVYRAPGAYVADNTRSVSFDVSAAVRADLNAGRTAFGWRIDPQAIPDAISSQRYFPTVENTDPAFPAENRGAVLCLRVPAEVSETSCNDGIDNDRDTLIDCADSSCDTALACRVPDYDLDGDVDQGDFSHLQVCYTLPFPAVIVPGCEDADLNNDTRIDLTDFDLFTRCMRGPEVSVSAGCLLGP